jgi:hypothetical protein
MYPKVQVLTTCEHCDGEAYLFDRVDVDTSGQSYHRHEPCKHCTGTGKMTQWITLAELADLIDRATALEPDWKMLASSKPTSQYQENRDAAGF